MRIFKYKKFAKFAKKDGISDAKLCEAVKEMERGIIHADLGGNVFKQRVQRRARQERWLSYNRFLPNWRAGLFRSRLPKVGTGKYQSNPARQVQGYGCHIS